MLIVMMGAGNGLQNGVNSEFVGRATNSFFMWTQRTSLPYKGLRRGRGFSMRNEDYTAIVEQIPDAVRVAPRNQLGGYRGGNNVTRGDKSGAFSVMGDYPQVAKIEGVIIEQGRFINMLDVADQRKVAVIGTRVREILFEADENPIGKSIEIQGVYFLVVGVFRTAQSGDRAERDTQRIYTPFSTFQKAFGYGNRIGWFAISSREGVPVAEVEDQVVDLLKRRHKISPNDDRAFGHFNLQEEYQKINGLFLGINILVWIVGIGTLAAGVIGVSNIMLVIVKERTKEIGVRRAIGATPWSIVSQILLEAIILTSVAGYIGVLLGVLSLEGVALILEQAGDTPMFKNPGVDLGLVLRALLILVVSGALAGIIPASRAISIAPVDALRAD